MIQKPETKKIRRNGAKQSERSKHPGTNQKLGKAGENAASRYLEKQGYRILTRNFRARTGEIDIVAVEPSRENAPGEMGVLVFVEVKTRRNLSYGIPALAVTKTKQQHLLMAANLYCYKNGLYGIPVRYDVIEVLVLGTKVYVHHIRNAFS